MDIKIKKPLSMFTLAMINVIAIDSLRNLSTNATYGLAVVFFYALGALFFVIPLTLVTAELATHYPKTGGVYIWVTEAFGAQWGFVTIWLQWAYNVVWYPTILTFMATNIAYLIEPQLAQQKYFMLPLIIAMFSLATLTNLFGMRISGLLSIVSAIIGTLIPALLLIGFGIFWVLSGKPSMTPLTPHALLPTSIQWHHIAYFVVLLFSLLGFEMSAVHAGDVPHPKRDYPRALWLSAFIVVTTMTLASIAISVVIPASKLGIISGIDQAFLSFLTAFHLRAWMPVVLLLIVLGGFGGMAAWVIGPTKGIMVAAHNGSAPALLGKTNRYGAPWVILTIQWCMVVILSSLFVIAPSFNAAYWALSVLTGQLALLFYIILFAAAIAIRHKLPSDPKAFHIPWGRTGLWLCAGAGLIICLTAIVFGFIPPKTTSAGHTFAFDALLAIGMVVFTSLPLLLFNKKGK